jgi:hypothetical protein
MRQEIKDLYGPNIGKSYEEDLQRTRSKKNYSAEQKRLAKYSEGETRKVQKSAASRKNTKVDREAMSKIEKEVNFKPKASKGSKLPQLAKQVKKVSTLAKLNPATLAAGVLAEKYGAMLINKGVDAVYEKLSKEFGKAPSKAKLKSAKEKAEKKKGKRKGRNQ